MAFGRTRTIVCHIGPRSAALESACKHRNLKYLKTTIEDALKQCEGDARAIVVVGGPVQLAKILGRGALRHALDNGVAFFAVDADKQGQVERLCGPDELSRRLGPREISPKDAELLPARAFPGGRGWPQRVAQECAEHDPGPSIAGGCEVENIDPDETHEAKPEEVTLIRRAFSDCAKVKIRYLTGGQSSARGPWLIDAQFRNGRSPVKWVVKIGGIREITEEINVVRDMCSNYIPFRHYPPVVGERCVRGATRRAMVSMYVEKAEELERYILTHRVDEIIVRIFDGPLELCRQGIEKEPVNIGQLFREWRIIPDASVLVDVWSRAHEVDPHVLRYDKLFALFASHASVDVMQVDSHGDLHLRNIFVIFVHEDRDVLLIDFSRWTKAPASYDPAILDAALAFDAPSGEAARVSDDQLLELYRPPLLDVGPMEPANNRVAAIIALRRKIRGTVSEVEYQLAVVGWLLFHAKRGSVTAYRCASRILQSLSSGAL